ncbi:nucleotidyltransferase domain-containing protein [bacterium]|nr:nucleotidyltransferase domain-containing protein [bacterium]
MSIVKKTSGLTGQIKQALTSLTDNIQIAFIFGSFAKTHQTPESDIDLF